MNGIQCRRWVKLKCLRKKIWGLETCLAKRNILTSYKKHESMKDYECFYCGSHAESQDHVPAASHAHYHPQYERILVRSCLLCNALLGARFLPTLYLRCSYLLSKYRWRLRKVISMPNWSEEEIEELKGRLKRQVIVGLKKKKQGVLSLKRLEALFEVLEPEENYSIFENTEKAFESK